MLTLTTARRRLVNVKLAAQGAIMEAPGLLGIDDPDTELSATQGGSYYFRRLTEGSKRDLTPLETSKMIEISAYLYQRNPVAKRVIERRTNYAVGDEIKLSCDDEKAQEVLDLWWKHDGWDGRILSTVNGWRAYGELMLPATVNPVNGRVRIGFLPNNRIKAVHHAPGNLYHLLYVEMESSDGQGFLYRIIGPDQDPMSDTYGELKGLSKEERETLAEMKENMKLAARAGSIPPGMRAALPCPLDPPGSAPRVVGECFFFPANQLPDQTRGISDLFPIADYLEAYETTVWNMTERAAIVNNIVGVMKHEGVSEDEIEEKADQWGDSMPASLSVVHVNEKTGFEIASPKISPDGAAEHTDIVLSVIATGIGVPKYWINASDDPNRANAEAMAAPVLRDMKEFQRQVKVALETMGRFVLAMAQEYGELASKKEGYDLSADLPALGDKKVAEAGTVLQAVGTAVTGLQDADLLDRETAIRSVVTVVKLLGVDVSYEDVRERLDEEEEEAEKEKEKEGNQQFGPPQQPPPPPPNGQQPPNPNQQQQQPPQGQQPPPPPPPQNGKGKVAAEALAVGLVEALGLDVRDVDARRVAESVEVALFGPRSGGRPKALTEHLPGKHDQRAHGKGGGAGDRSGSGMPGAQPELDTEHMHKGADGKWSAERQALHDSVMDGAMAGVPTTKQPVVRMTGGGPASGKGGLIKNGHVKTDDAVLSDPDEMKKKLPEYQKAVEEGHLWAASHVHEESSYMSKRLIGEAVAAGHNVVYDSTGDSAYRGDSANPGLADKVEAMRAAGAARIEADYATIPTDMALERNAERAARTGRMPPADYVVSQHAKVSRVVEQASKEGLFDRLTLWDTTSREVRKIATFERGKPPEIYDQKGWDDFLAKGR